MLVLLRALLVGDVHPLAGELAAGQFTDAGDDVDERVVGLLGDELGPVVVGIRGPRLDEAGQVLEQEVARHGEIGEPAIGVGGLGVVGDRPGAGPVGGEVLAPQQELDRVPPRRDVGLAALFVERRDQLGIDRRVGVGIVDDAGRLVTLDVVDVRLVERPRVDQALRPGLLVVDRTAVEAERLGQPVVVTRRQPRLLGGFERLVGRIGGERVDGGVHLRGRGERCLVRGVHSGRVVLDHLLLVVGARPAVVTAAGGQAGRADQRDDGEPSHSPFDLHGGR